MSIESFKIQSFWLQPKQRIDDNNSSNSSNNKTFVHTAASSMSGNFHSQSFQNEKHHRILSYFKLDELWQLNIVQARKYDDGREEEKRNAEKKQRINAQSHVNWCAAVFSIPATIWIRFFPFSFSRCWQMVETIVIFPLFICLRSTIDHQQ